MTKLLHVLGVLIVVPYLALAVFFLVVGKVASTTGLWAALDAALESFNWWMSWGVVGFSALVVAVAAMGLFVRTQYAANIALVMMTGVSLVILLFYRASPISSGELLFLLPCALTLLYGLVRTRMRPTRRQQGTNSAFGSPE